MELDITKYRGKNETVKRYCTGEIQEKALLKELSEEKFMKEDDV